VAELDTGRVHPRVGSGRVTLDPYLVGRVGSGPFVWVCVGHPGLYKMCNLSVIVKFTLLQTVVCLPTNCAGRQQSLSSVCLSSDWQ